MQLGEGIPLTGIVVNEDGQPVIDAKVQISPKSSSEYNDGSYRFTMDFPFLSTRADRHGHFTFLFFVLLWGGVSSGDAATSTGMDPAG